LHQFITAFIENENEHRSIYSDSAIKVPSLSTIHRAVKRINPYLRDLHHHGKKIAEKNSNFGFKQVPPSTLLSVVEGDAHLVDLELIDDMGNNLGRPWLYVLIEVMTRCIIGWELSFTPPCAEKVIRAFRMALMVSTNGEPGGRMEELILDNGVEGNNHIFKNIARLVGFKLTFAPPGCPNAKSHVERFFGTLNTSLIHPIPGTTFSNPEMKGDYKSEKKACLTLEQLQGILSRWIRDVYHTSYHTGINNTPRSAWDTAVKIHFPPERYSQLDLDALCRSLTYRKITGGRVTFEYLSWTGPALPYVAKELKTGQQAMIFYDSSDLAKVWVAHPDRPSELYEAYATEPDYQNGLTLFEHKLVRSQLKKERHLFSGFTARHALLKIHEGIQFIGERRRTMNSSKKDQTNSESKKAPTSQKNNYDQQKKIYETSEVVDTPTLCPGSVQQRIEPYRTLSLPSSDHE
jgi:putative transposase